MLSSLSAFTAAVWPDGQGHGWALRLGALPLAGCATLEKLIDFSGLQFLHLEERDNNSTYLTELLQRLNEIQVKHSQGLVKKLINKD